MVLKMALIRGNGGLNIRFYVRDPEKAHFCAEPRVLAYFASKSVQGPWLQRFARTPPPKKKHLLVCNLARKVTHARKGNPWAYCDELLHRCRGPGRNHLCQFLWLPRTGFRRGWPGLGVKFWASPLICIVALTTLSHYRCKCAILLNLVSWFSQKSLKLLPPDVRF